MTDKRSPHVVAAVFCERAIAETDGVHTLVRLVTRHQETFAIPADSEPDAVEAIGNLGFSTNLTFFVSVWPEEDGTHSVEVNFLYEEGGEVLPGVTREHQFTAGVGMNLRVLLRSAFPRAGLVWAQVFVDGELKTRSPLTLSRTKELAQ
jgi:hypothetical protein